MNISQLIKYCSDSVDLDNDVSLAYIEMSKWEVRLREEVWVAVIDVITYNTVTGDIISFGNTDRDVEHIVGKKGAFDWDKGVVVEVIAKEWYADFEVK